MTSHNLGSVSSAHVRFGDLDFIIMTEGELAMAPTIIQPLHSAGLDAIAEALEELQLHAPKAHAPRERPAPWLRLREVRASARRLPRTLTVPEGPMPPHLLVHQRHDATCWRGTALPRIPHLECPNSIPVRSTQRRRDRWPPRGIAHAPIPYE